MKKVDMVANQSFWQWVIVGPIDFITQWRRDWRTSVSDADTAGQFDLASGRRTYGAWWVYIIDVVAIIALSTVFSLVAVAIVLLLAHDNAARNSLFAAFSHQQLSDPLFELLLILAADIPFILVIGAHVHILRQGWESVGWGLSLKANALNSIVKGVGLGIVIIIVSSLIGVALTAGHVDTSGQDAQLITPLRTHPGFAAFLTILAGSVIAPICEELFFRGYLFRALAIRVNIWVGYAGSALVFGLIHETEFGNFAAVTPLIVVGILLAYGYQRTGNMLTNTTAHITNNSLAFLVTLVTIGSPVTHCTPSLNGHHYPAACTTPSPTHVSVNHAR